MGLVFLVAKFQGFISKILQIVLTRDEQVFEKLRNTSAYTNSFRKLSTTSVDPEELKDDVLEDMISNLHGVDVLNNWLKDYLALDLRLSADRWDSIVEIFERRNIIVHKDGKVTAKYRRIIKRQVNEEYLSVDKEYLSKSLSTIGNSANEIYNHLMKNFVNKRKSGACSDE